MVRRLGLMVLLLALAQRGIAQQPIPAVDTTRVVELHLTDGTFVTGKVVAEDVATLTLVTAAGVRVAIPLVALMSWREATAPGAAHAFRRDPNDSRLFLGHTARTVPRGRGYVLDYLVFFPVASYGLTERVTLTGGMSLIPFLPDQLFYVAPKVGLVQSPSVSLAAGVLYLRIVGFVPASGYAGIAYGVATVGGEAAAATVLVGYPFAESDWGKEPLVILGGESRVSARVKVMVEGWKLPGADEVPAIGGVRLIGEHVSWDFGLLFLLGASENTWGFLPWIDVSIHF
jgi:hypothetical protein